MRHSMAWPRGVSARAGSIVEALAARDADLPMDEVDAGHHLGHRMLDLQPRVHLEEVERAVSRRAGTRSCRRSCSRPARATGGRGRRDLLAQRGVDRDRRRLLDHLLMPPLDRALALDERDDGAEADRRAAESRCAAAARGGARGRRSCRRTRRRLRTARCESPAADPPGVSTTRMPLPPPPATALTTSG